MTTTPTSIRGYMNRYSRVRATYFSMPHRAVGRVTNSRMIAVDETLLANAGAPTNGTTVVSVSLATVREVLCFLGFVGFGLSTDLRRAGLSAVCDSRGFATSCLSSRTAFRNSRQRRWLLLDRPCVDPLRDLSVASLVVLLPLCIYQESMKAVVMYL